MNEQKKLLKMIQSYCFVIQETVLYLDTHPSCRAALRHLEKYKKLLAEAEALYEKKYAQLTHTGGDCSSTWKWVKEPWPWEIC